LSFLDKYFIHSGSSSSAITDAGATCDSQSEEPGRTFFGMNGFALGFIGCSSRRVLHDLVGGATGSANEVSFVACGLNLLDGSATFSCAYFGVAVAVYVLAVLALVLHALPMVSKDGASDRSCN
jgi:hypothetical protein